MSDWMFDDGSATSLLNQDYGAGAPPPGWDEAYASQGAPSEDTFYSGDLPDGGEVDPVVVTGPGQQPDTPPGGWPGRETEVDVLSPEPPTEDPPCAPPPDGPTPAGVDMNELRRKARDLANDAAGEDNDVEWGGLIWQASDGSLHVTSLRTSGSDETAAFALGEVGPGGRIVATFPHAS